jgi:hypothetical protein
LFLISGKPAPLCEPTYFILSRNIERSSGRGNPVGRWRRADKSTS